MRKKCKARGCGKHARLRGLCNNCYACAWRAVRTGKTTWQELVATGRALEVNVTGRPRKVWT